MRFDLNSNTQQLNTLPSFQLAKTRLNKLSYAISVCFFMAGLLLILAMISNIFSAHSFWSSIFCNNAAALILLAAITQSALRIDRWRCNAFVLFSELDINNKPKKTSPVLSSNNVDADVSKPPKNNTIKLKITHLLNLIGLGSLQFVCLSIVAFMATYYGWDLSLSYFTASKLNYAVAGVLVFMTFSLLVVERHLSIISKNEWPEAAYIALIIRVVIAVQILSLFCLLFIDAGRIWPQRVLVLTGLLPMMVALEFVLRGLFSFFSPQRDTLQPPLIGESIIAAMLCWPPKPFKILQDELQTHFNIDLRQVWAFSFIRRAFFPIFVLILIVGWLLSSINEISINQRGIYERFGQPVAVVKSGLHIGLPWPFGRVIPVENGVIHEIATSSRQTIDDLETLTVEGPAPSSANRLWDASHYSEKSQIIASTANDKQSFQILNMDVRFIYRIGSSDEDALNATYNNLDIATLIQSTGNRVLVHDFASRTLDDVLSGQTKALASDIRHALQQNLNQMKSGVEILAVVVESIHPPSGAADAYHGVQAAQITSQTLIAQERGYAANKLSDANISAMELVDQANAEAKETISSSQSDTLIFRAQKTAWQQNNTAFSLEQYFNQLDKSLSKAPLLIIDHRLKSPNIPTIDLRKYNLPLDAETNSSLQNKRD